MPFDPTSIFVPLLDAIFRGGLGARLGGELFRFLGDFLGGFGGFFLG